MLEKVSKCDILQKSHKTICFWDKQIGTEKHSAILRVKEALIQSLSYFAISIIMQDKEKGDANSEAI